VVGDDEGGPRPVVLDAEPDLLLDAALGDHVELVGEVRVVSRVEAGLLRAREETESVRAVDRPRRA